MPSVGSPDQEAVERHREGGWVETPQGPPGRVVVGWEGNGGGPGFLAGYRGQVRGQATCGRIIQKITQFSLANHLLDKIELAGGKEYSGLVL